VSRILLLIKGLGRGGAEQLLLSAAPHVDRDRFEYEVAYLLPWKNALVGSLEQAGMPVHCLDGARGLGWLTRLRALVRRREIELVHSHSPVPAVGARLSVPRVRQVYTEHNVWGRYHRATYWANVLTFPRTDHVFAVSDQVRESIRYPRWLRGRRMPQVETVYHGLDPDAIPDRNGSDGIRRDLGIPDDAPIVGTVANFKAQKGHAQLLQAALRVREAVPDVRFVLVGTGPLEDEMRRRGKEMGLNRSVVFAGFREDVPRVADTFDVFCLPSTYEGLSIALIEAMSLGKPVVVTAVGGHPEVVTEAKDGFLVPPGDPSALADRLITLLRDRELRLRLGRSAKERAAAFDIRDAIRRIEAVYSEVLG
jgi:glycosyltransferase involved in cell wall biosynthesis